MQVGQHWPGSWMASSQFIGGHFLGKQEIFPNCFMDEWVKTKIG